MGKGEGEEHKLLSSFKLLESLEGFLSSLLLFSVPRILMIEKERVCLTASIAISVLLTVAPN